MNRRDFMKTTGLGVAALALSGITTSVFAQARGAKKPNIIIILTDDVGISEIGCYGSDRYKTPNIDRLAQTGGRFEYCYAAPVCGPSRCQLLTGRYPFRTGLNSNQSHDAIAPDREIMIPAVMKKAGYMTGHAGKWGQMCLGPGEWGFDEYMVYGGSGKYWGKQLLTYRQNGESKKVPEGAYIPDLMHDFTVDFITRHKDKPFFFHYSMSHAHTPIVRTPDSAPDSKTLYADNIRYMDKLVGKLTAELDKLKLRESTLILFAGDNGTAGAGAGPDSSTLHGRRISGQKGSLLEGGSRVPLIANWPGTAPAGRYNKDLTDFSDFFPTVAELGGATLPPGVTIDGHSFAAPIKDEQGKPREWVYVEYNGHSYVRNARWKLTSSGNLFDMKEAPFEELPVPAGSKDPDAMAARTTLQAILDKHPAAPATGKRKRKSGGANQRNPDQTD